MVHFVQKKTKKKRPRMASAEICTQHALLKLQLNKVKSCWVKISADDILDVFFFFSLLFLYWSLFIVVFRREECATVRILSN